MNLYDFQLRLITILLTFSAATTSFAFYRLWNKKLAFFFAGFLMGISSLTLGEFISFTDQYIGGMWFSSGSWIIKLLSFPSTLFFTYFGLMFIFALKRYRVTLIHKVIIIFPVFTLSLIRELRFIPEFFVTIPIVLTSLYMVIVLLFNLKDNTEPILNRSIKIVGIELAAAFPFIGMTLSNWGIELTMRVVYIFIFTLAVESLIFTFKFFSSEPMFKDGVVSEKFKSRYSLTPRELEIVTQIVNGLKNREIAERLFISERTVTTHITNIYAKINVKNRVQLLNLFNSSL